MESEGQSGAGDRLMRHETGDLGQFIQLSLSFCRAVMEAEENDNDKAAAYAFLLVLTSQFDFTLTHSIHMVLIRVGSTSIVPVQDTHMVKRLQGAGAVLIKHGRSGTHFVVAVDAVAEGTAVMALTIYSGKPHQREVFFGNGRIMWAKVLQMREGANGTGKGQCGTGDVEGGQQ